MTARYYVGVDIGGTFTDFVVMEATSGAVWTLKSPSAPSDPARAVLNGVRELIEAHGIDPTAITYFVHGTTLAVNTIIQRSGAKTGLLTTRGFRDVLEIGRLRLPDPTNFFVEKIKPLVARTDVREIDERLMADGSVYRALDLAEVDQAVRELLDQGIESLAICFMHAYRSDQHERAAAAHVREHFPNLYVSTSAEIWPQQREYERALISVMNSHIGQRLAEYFDHLAENLGGLGVPAAVLTTRSNGGVMTAASARRAPVETLLSGPASGVIGACHVGRQTGHHQLITLDMGGTSADIAVIDGDVVYSTENRVGDFPVIMPAVDVTSIGAGGGSIGWIDSAGILKVGPKSAGADPGPACYGKQGEGVGSWVLGVGGRSGMAAANPTSTNPSPLHHASPIGDTVDLASPNTQNLTPNTPVPTVTDAYVQLGFIQPERFLGGRVRLDPSLAEAALRQLGAPLGFDATRTAAAIVDVATANMYAQFTPLMASKGIDPRDFALLAYGGAGPTHAFLLAREVGIRQVIVPRSPGTLCAFGCLVTDLKSDFVYTLYVEASDIDAAALERAFAELEARAGVWLEAQHAPVTARATIRSADMRYKGQSFEVTTPLAGHVDDLATVLRSFHQQYERIYSFADPLAPVEIINVRVTIVGSTPKPAFAAAPLATGSANRAPTPIERRRFHEDGQWIEAQVYQRDTLAAGDTFTGPAIVEAYDTTVVIPSGYAVTVDQWGNLLAKR